MTLQKTHEAESARSNSQIKTLEQRLAALEAQHVTAQRPGRWQ